MKIFCSVLGTIWKPFGRLLEPKYGDTNWNLPCWLPICIFFEIFGAVWSASFLLRPTLASLWVYFFFFHGFTRIENGRFAWEVQTISIFLLSLLYCCAFRSESLRVPVLAGPPMQNRNFCLFASPSSQKLIAFPVTKDFPTLSKTAILRGRS